MYPGPSEFRLIGYSIESIWTQKIQIKYITRDEWNHLLCLCNISHFSSTVCSETMAKEYNKIQEKKESQRSRGQ